MKLVKRLFKFLLNSFIIGASTLLLFELCYRTYLIDFYKSEFENLNKHFQDREGSPNIMVIGDSFSAYEEGYVKTLHDSLPQYKVTNFSIAGTSIREQFMFGKYHLKREKPDVLIFQYYVGNDLFGWNHPMNWDDISFVRNVYWWLSERIWSLGYINYKIGQIKASNISEKDMSEFNEAPFSPQMYTLRDRIYFNAEPYLVENSTLLKNGRNEDLSEYLERVEALFGYAGADCKIYVLIIPHAAQLNENYVQKFKRIGAEFTDDFVPGEDSIPLKNKISSFFSENGQVEILDPLSMLAELEEEGGQTYFSNDSHMNEFGQNMIGMFLLKNLRESVIKKGKN